MILLNQPNCFREKRTGQKGSESHGLKNCPLKSERTVRSNMGISVPACFILTFFFLSIFLGSGHLSIFSQERRTFQAQIIRTKPFPIALQNWTFRKFSFLETIEFAQKLGIKYLQAYPGQILSREKPDVVFNHHLKPEDVELVQNKLKQAGVELVAYGVVDLGKTEEEKRKVFDFARRLGIQLIVAEPSENEFPSLEPLLEEYNLFLAIHNHPEPSRYARPEKVLAVLKRTGDRIGVCADPGHWMRGKIKPVEALRLLQGRLLDIHLKDRSDFGVGEKVEDVPPGKGKAGLKEILEELTRQNYSGYLTLEYENEKEALNPLPALKEAVELINKNTYFYGYEELLTRARGRYSKHGWNHYGPGHFELDEKEGILKSVGGMGLFWYSRKKFRDFILELDYKCSDRKTNSGVFLRVPEVPTSDDYIYHSFEIQINDAGEGIHKTGAVYDAVAPAKDAFNPAGEWNHLKIIFKGKQLQVELNGVKIIDWLAEPRGKVRDFASEGYIGLQNHDRDSSVYFRNIFIKEIK
jgi:sugar phosphate isomerase/epimerase